MNVGSSITLERVGPIHRINGIIDRYVYTYYVTSYYHLPMSICPSIGWVFQTDNDAKHSTQSERIFKSLCKYFAMAQSPDLNPIEMV